MTLMQPTSPLKTLVPPALRSVGTVNTNESVRFAALMAAGVPLASTALAFGVSTLQNAAFWNGGLLLVAPELVLLVAGITAALMTLFWLLAAVAAPASQRSARQSQALVWMGLTLLSLTAQASWALMLHSFVCTS